MYYKNASFCGVLRELLIESRSVKAHKQPDTGALVEETRWLRKSKLYFYQKSMLKSNYLIDKKLVIKMRIN